MSDTFLVNEREYPPSATSLAHVTVGSVGGCKAVSHLQLKYSAMFKFFWDTAFTAAVCAAFPSLTSLSIVALTLTSGQLHNLLSHPPMVQHLRSLDTSQLTITDCIVSDYVMADGDHDDVEDDSINFNSSVFSDSRLQHLTVSCGQWDYVPHLSPLAPHLTRLRTDSRCCGPRDVMSPLASALTTLSNLQCLDLAGVITSLLQEIRALPRLHTLIFRGGGVAVHGAEELPALLALTQVTNLQLHR
ncbi:hypothetical protein V8C86DRAFT_3116328 [Haematococcus lacustris]